MKTLEIRFIDLIDCCFVEATILDLLRKAGIPVSGLFSFKGIESGTLYERMSLDGLGLIYDWKNS
jgi:hypothetical protein